MDNINTNAKFSFWFSAIENLKNELTPQIYEFWLKPIIPLDLTDSLLKIGVPDDFFKTWILEHYAEKIQKALRVTSGIENIDIELVIVGSAATTDAQDEQKQPDKPTQYVDKSFKSMGLTNYENESVLNSKYTFDSFVVGPSNRFSQAACMAVAESPAKAYNPLFIYGPVGLGKTHLMQAIGHEILRRNPAAKILYITSEKFTNQLINAIKTGTTVKFREKYRTVDCLLIDDIHFIAGKDATMEEFFHTFNTLYDSHKQIVVSSDKSPKGISNLEERLVSRFEWGLVTDIQIPDFETRTAILRKKAEREGLNVPDAVTSFIADKIKSNIRELEGALIRVVAYSKLVGKEVDETVAQEVLKDLIVESQTKITVDLIQRKVSQYFEIRPSDMTAKRRSRSVAFPRHIAMYLCREITSLSFPEIGEQFGGRDHTTVLHACDKIKKDIKRDPKIKGVIDHLMEDIRK